MNKILIILVMLVVGCRPIPRPGDDLYDQSLIEYTSERYDDALYLRYGNCVYIIVDDEVYDIICDE